MLRLLELKLIRHPIIGNLNLTLSDDIDSENSSYNTILIGPNGTGKSYLLQTIVNIFRDGARYLKRIEKKTGYVEGIYYLKYLFREKIVEIANFNFAEESIDKTGFNSSINFFVDGRISNDIYFLPAKILASSMIFTDKFPAVEDKNLPQYSYLGVRNIRSPLSAGTRVINTRVVDSLTNSLSKKGFLELLKKVLTDLDYSPSIKIRYVPKYRTLFYRKDISVEKLEDMFTNWRDAFKERRSAPWGLGYFTSIQNNKPLLTKIVNFLKTKDFKSYGRGGQYFQYDLLKENINTEEYEVLFHLHKLDLVSFPNIELAKLDSKFGINESSSGEQNILFTLLTLLANVENNSIILIDEPELSLHPNWQMQYFSILRDVFKQYTGLHFLVATHSHFLLSDIEGEVSKIIGLKKDNGIIKVVDLPENINTYGWAAEDILYNVFDVLTVRNKYVASAIGDILDQLSTSAKDEISSLGNEKYQLLLYLQRNLREIDPLKDVVNSILKKVTNNAG